MAQGFKTVLELVRGYQQLWIYWPKYYNFKNPVICDYLMKQLEKPRYSTPTGLSPLPPHRWTPGYISGALETRK